MDAAIWVTIWDLHRALASLETARSLRGRSNTGACCHLGDPLCKTFIVDVAGVSSTDRSFAGDGITSLLIRGPVVGSHGLHIGTPSPSSSSVSWWGTDAFPLLQAPISTSPGSSAPREEGEAWPKGQAPQEFEHWSQNGHGFRVRGTSPEPGSRRSKTLHDPVDPQNPSGGSVSESEGCSYKPKPYHRSFRPYKALKPIALLPPLRIPRYV